MVAKSSPILVVNVVASIAIARYLVPPFKPNKINYPTPSGGGISLADFGGHAVVGVIVACFVVMVCIGIAIYKFFKKSILGILKKLKNLLNNTPPPPETNMEVLLEADAATMEKLFKEITKEKPVKFSAQQLFTFTSNFSTQIECGGFGEVYKGEFPNGVKIAVKLFNNISLLDKKVEEQFMAEICSISRTHHVNVVKLYGYCYGDSMAAIVLEFIENGSLDEYLFGQTQGIECGSLHNIAIGTARGLAHLHEECQQKISHYHDIRPQNIYLDVNLFPKVCNFRDAKYSNRNDTGDRGSSGYLAPEFTLTNYPITHKCDVYSFGMVLFEIIRRKSNANPTTFSESCYWFPQQVWDAYEKGKLKELVVGCGIGEDDAEKASRACEVALWCVQDCSDERPRMSVVVKMLEGGVEIMPPPKPFQYSNMIQTTSLQRTQSNSQWYRETNPSMNENVIQISVS